MQYAGKKQKTEQPAARFRAIARGVEKSTYAKLFPWTCLGVLLAAALPLALLDPATNAYSANAAWSDGVTAVLALLFGLGTAVFSRATNSSSGRIQILLGAVLLVCLAVTNALLLLETNEIRHTIGAVLIMLAAAAVHPQALGLVIVCLPQLALVTWLAVKSGWSLDMQIVFLATFSGSVVAALVFYAKRTYFRRLHALLAERASMLETLRRDSTAQALQQETVLSERNLTTLGRLAGGIAHDLNNILVPILGNATMLEESSHTSVQQRQARDIMRAAARARRLTQQLGYFATRGDREQETLDLNRTLAELCPIVWRTFPQGIDIDFKLADSPLFLETSRTDLQDLLTKLMLDAGNAANSGNTVALRVLPEVPPPPNFQTEANTTYCAVIIDDGAEPMSTKQRDGLFEPGTSSGGDNRGIGLLGAREQAQSLGGFLDVESAAEGGNQFFLFLPVKAPDLKEPTSTEQQLRAGVATEVLVVDDEPAVRRVTAQLLQRAGFVVRESESGEQALTQIHNHLPDAIVMDLRMPGMGGEAAAKAIRAQNLNLPIVICTGFTGDAEGWLSDIKRCTLLQKPYDSDALIAAVNSLLRAGFVTE